MPSRSSKDHDFTTVARRIVEQAHRRKAGWIPARRSAQRQDPAAVALGKLASHMIFLLFLFSVVAMAFVLREGKKRKVKPPSANLAEFNLVSRPTTESVLALFNALAQQQFPGDTPESPGNESDGHRRAELREQRWYGTTELEDDHLTQGRSRQKAH